MNLNPMIEIFLTLIPDALHFLTTHLVDIGVGGVSFVIGAFLSRRKDKLQGIGIFLQISLLLAKMAKYYYDTHPEARKRLDQKTKVLIDKIYQSDLQVHDRYYKSSEETNALG